MLKLIHKIELDLLWCIEIGSYDGLAFLTRISCLSGYFLMPEYTYTFEEKKRISITVCQDEIIAIAW